MRFFRVHLTDGLEHEVWADRAVADPASTCFQVRAHDRWDVVLRVPTDRIASLTRRLTEVQGAWLWVPTQPQPASLPLPADAVPAPERRHQ